MIRSEVNNKLREFARSLSPTERERETVSKVYSSLQEILGKNKCIQIGSYPRYTAITPIHDLDILYVIGEWSDNNDLQDPEYALDEVKELVRSSYANYCPNGYSYRVDVQNHSVVIELKGEAEFSVDIVPCYEWSKNEYDDHMYKVPEVIKVKDHSERKNTYWNPTDKSSWISSDPRGYIKQAQEVGSNGDFRKTVKIVKYWKQTLRNIDNNLKLKSFHLEQVITRQFLENPEEDLIGALFYFFTEISNIVDHPDCIEDRAQRGKYINDYLKTITDRQKSIIKKTKDMVLVRLESIDDYEAEYIFKTQEYNRDPSENFIFDFGYLSVVDLSHQFDISYDQQDKFENRRQRRARMRKGIPKQKELYFKIIDGFEKELEYYWKVQNSKKLDKDKRRGEITKGQTRNNPEHTEYTGEHYVECFGVNNSGECVRRARCEVVIGD